MITTSNEFETIKAFTHIAGCSLGTRTALETCAALIDCLDKTTQIDTCKLWRELAQWPDNGRVDIWELQQDVADQITENAPLADYCTVSLNDGEWRVIPYVPDDIDRVDDIPEDYTEDQLLYVNDHGNVTLYHWHDQKREYIEVWSMV